MKKMPLPELAQYTCRGMKQQGINVTLSGGACVSIYTENAYQSIDLDFIREMGDTFQKASEAMEALGFTRQGRRFIHPQSEFYVEFPAPPLTVGEERPKEIVEHMLNTALGNIPVTMLSPTDCIKDRLCGFFHWNDLQSLDQALMVAARQPVDLREVRRWAAKEGMAGKHRIFAEAVRKAEQKETEG